ncbi:MAG: diguanylate cyclase [Candidatus Lernaella stagnicola]|nr:diguanylate cyclase [Candidatus Lernaella stagnicola]
MERVRKRILVVDPNEDRGQEIVAMLVTEDYFGYLFSSPNMALSQIYNDPPDLIILAAQGENWKMFLNTLKNDTVFGHLAVLCLFEPAQLRPETSFTDIPIDDYTALPIDLEDLRLRVRLAMDKSGRYLDANPLSRLPGNFTIIKTLQNRIDQRMPFCFAHVDIDNFKPFNDRYGFSRGDEVIRMTARVLVNTVRNFPNSQGFVGHIGGDDFVLIVNPAVCEPIFQQVLVHYDMLAATFYDDEDRMRGYIESVDRQGNSRRFPLISLSIAGIDSTRNDYDHFGQFSAAANEIKKKVKQKDGSNYMIDRRQIPPPDDEDTLDPTSEPNAPVN